MMIIPLPVVHVIFWGFGWIFPILICSYMLLCLVVTFHFLPTCVVPSVLFPSCAPPQSDSPPHLSHIILVITALLPVSLHLHVSLDLSLCYSLILRWFVCFCPHFSPVCFSGLSSVFVFLLYFPLPSFCRQFLLCNISSFMCLDFCLSVSCLLVSFVLTVTVERRGGL